MHPDDEDDDDYGWGGTMVAVAFVLGTAMMIAGIILGLAWLSGATFGQRCEHAFPDNGLAQERCVYDLSRGSRL